MATTDNSIDVLLIDGGVVVGTALVTPPEMRPPVRRTEMNTRPAASRVDE